MSRKKTIEEIQTEIRDLDQRFFRALDRRRWKEAVRLGTRADRLKAVLERRGPEGPRAAKPLRQELTTEARKRGSGQK